MTEPTLSEYQNQFADDLLSEQLIFDESPKVLNHIVSMFNNSEVDGSANLEAMERFTIYRNNVILSLITAIADTYPVVKRLVGDEFFNGIAKEFVRKTPPQKPSLLFYGQGFIDFIRDFPACSAMPYLADVAKLEWCNVRSFHAADEELLDNNLLATIAPESLAEVSFTLQPSVRLMRSDWPVDTIWEENLKDDVATLNLEEFAPSNLLIYRHQLQVQVVNLQIDCYHFLYAFSAGKDIANAWEYTITQQQLESREELDENELSGMLGYLLSLGLFSSAELPS
ncbi:MAG: hypothetical protein ACI9N9_000937 [Enterobacterales bacterium]|jgi:hypothetical protein